VADAHRPASNPAVVVEVQLPFGRARLLLWLCTITRGWAGGKRVGRHTICCWEYTCVLRCTPGMAGLSDLSSASVPSRTGGLTSLVEPLPVSPYELY